jgi:DHA3 family macrolide efflux protein-like MFS transporter
MPLGRPAARSGPLIFGIVWAGQLVSTVGSGLTTFALGLTVYGATGSVTNYALIGFCAVAPRVILSPVAGVLVDRWDRRQVMLASDVGGLILTAAILALVATHQLDVWEVYVAAGIGGAFAAFQWPAWSAATTLLVPPRHFARAAGLATLAQAASDILAPLLAAALLVTVGLGPILVLDLVSFAVAVGALSIVRFPGVITRTETALGPVIAQLGDGWRYIRGRPELLSLVGFLAIVNFLWGIVAALFAPLVLGFSSPQGLGFALSVAGAGMITGSVLMAATGGPSRRVFGVVLAELASGLAFVAMGFRPELALVAAGAFAAHVTIPVIFSCNQAIWQQRVPPELQGRVFSTRQAIERAFTPLAFVVAGPLAEHVFNPLMRADGTLAGTLGQVIGVGPVRGIGLVFVVMGLIQIGLGFAGLAYRRLRELDLPGAIG